MDLIKQKAITRGIDHVPASPTLEMIDINVVYSRLAESSLTSRSDKAENNNKALDGITFRVTPGQQIAIIGPNGAGKTTLFKIIAGTIKPSSGEVNIYGHEPDRHICIAYVPQRNQIDWSFPATVEEVVMMGRVGQIGLFRWPHRSDWEIVHESLSRVNLSDLRKLQIGKLSGGQQQRVFIARALAQRADLLLLDEPFTGLDAPSHEAILGILESLRTDEVTVLVATHDLNLAAERFELVMLLNKKVIGFGHPGVVLSTENLLRAYGGHMHVLENEEKNIILADTCCDHDEEVIEP